MLLVLVIPETILEAVRALLDLLERGEDILLAHIDGPLQDVLVRLVILVSVLHKIESS